MMPRRFVFALMIMLLCGPLVGCGPSYPKTHPVSGKITFRGQPVTQGTVVFYPEEGRPAMSDIAADGSYRLTTFRTGDGALPGRHAVTIRSIAAASAGPASMEEEMQQGMLGRDEGGVRWLVPERYSRREASGLVADVPAEAGVLNFELAE